MTEPEEDAREDAPGTSAVRMRRGFLGYKRADVDRALTGRDETVEELTSELDAREAELAQLRQDTAALWLAFAQHDRMLSDLRAAVASLPQAGSAPDPAPEPTSDPEPEPEPAQPEEPPVGHQLAELDEVLAAIEMATQTLEQTYAKEIEEAQEGEPTEGPEEEPGRVDDPEAEIAAGDEPSTESSGDD